MVGLHRLLQAFLSVFFIYALASSLNPAPAQAGAPPVILGDAVSASNAGQTQVQPAYIGCTRVDNAAINAGFEQQVVDLVNQIRAENGLPPLKRNSNLDLSARYHARDMMDDNYFSHDTQDRRDGSLVNVCSWSTRIINYYPSWEFLAENIAAGYSTPADVMAGWMDSPGHRANILSGSAREIGVGYMESGGNYGRYWVQDYGRSPNVYPIIINRDAAATSSLQVNLFIYGQGAWDEMRLRNDANTWNAWQPFQPSLNWTLPATVGNHTVSVELRKTGEATGASSSDTIYVNGGMTNLPDQLYFIYNQSTRKYLPRSVRVQPDNSNSAVSVHWSATANNSWINLSTATGVTPNSSLDIAPQSTAIDLSKVNTYTGSVTITADTPIVGSPHTIKVVLTIIESMPYQSFLPTIRH